MLCYCLLYILAIIQFVFVFVYLLTVEVNYKDIHNIYINKGNKKNKEK